MTMTDHELDARLGAARMANPALPLGAVSLLSREARQQAHRRSVRATLGTGAVIAAVGIGAVTAGPAVAQNVRQFLAQSGWIASGTEVVTGSIWVDTSAPDLTEYLATVFPDVPLAPGQTRATVIATVVSEQSAGLIQEVGLERAIDRQVRIGWLAEWISAHQAGDQARTVAAAKALVASTRWHGFVATDGGGTVATDTAFVTAIAGGDADAAQAFAQFDRAPSWDGVDREPLIESIVASAKGDK